MNKKAQTWSFDLIIAVILFVVIVALFYSFMVAEEVNDNKDLKKETDVLIYKLDCDSESDFTNCVVDDEVLNITKIEALYTQDYETLKNELGVNNNFCIYVRRLDGSVKTIEGQLGIGSDEFVITEDGMTCSDIVGGP